MRNGLKIAVPLWFVAGAALAQDAPEDDLSRGWDLLSEGSRLILEGLMEDLAPRIETEVAPLLDDLAERLGALPGYFPPEMLPNGDILIRRRPPTSPEAEIPDGPVDL